MPPAMIAVQVPALPVSPHDMQMPVQAVLQQIPREHMPLLHSTPSTQVPPFGLRPQEPLLPQTPGGAQSASAVQVDLQVVAPQRKGKQEVAVGTTHDPAPSQVDWPVWVVVPAGQVAAPQEVPCAYRWQAPPWHLPLVPQLAAPRSTQVAVGSGWPSGVSEQRPIEPASAQDLQAL